MDKLLLEIKRLGYDARIIPIDHLNDIKKDIEKHCPEGELREEVYCRYLSSMQFNKPKDFPDACSIIVVAVPRPQSQASFKTNHRKHTFTIPPTYQHYYSIPHQIEKTFSKILNPIGYRIVKTRLPEKLLSVHAGLTYYGRNNICYHSKFGSFFQIISYYSNIPPPSDVWFELRMLEQCKNCIACFNVCPTRAINKNRSIINAEKCLTFFNENSGEFPEWINLEAHNSLIGCMLCQQFCPENKKVKNWIDEKIEFDQIETENFLNTHSFNKLPKILQDKIIKLDLLDTHIEFQNLQRNLQVLLSKNKKHKNS